jgi:CYTH domain-containing protein
MASEIERRFRFDPKHWTFIPPFQQSSTIEQHYLSVNPQIRIRRKISIEKSDIFTLTIKKGVGLVREESECRITEEVYNGMKSATIGCLLKHRHEFRYLERNFFLDIFIAGPLAGKMFIEVEFESIADAENFDLIKQNLPWIGEEITHLHDYPNYAAAGLANPNQ